MKSIHALCTLLAGLLFQSNAFALSESDILPAAEAFTPTLHADAATQTLQLRFDIQDGYYLYRDKISLSAQTDGLSVAPLQTPPGKTKDDEFFGEIEIYRGPVEAVATLSDTGGLSSAQLQVRYQGCADVGICYPPTTQTFDVDLAAFEAPSAPEPGEAPFSLSSFSSLSGGGADEFLEPDSAFRVDAKAGTDGTVLINFDIAEGYYLYKDKITVTGDASVAALSTDLPEGEIHEDAYFGRTETYRYVVPVQVHYNKASDSAENSLIEVNYQGCADEGLCYPPMSKTFNLALAPANAVTASDPSTAAVNSPAKSDTADSSSTPAVTEQDALATALGSSGSWTIAATFFGLGLLLAFTPCVFPMIPILSSLIVGQGEKISTGRAFILSLVYVLAMALTYTVVGIIVGLSGENVQAVFQNPWVLGAFAALFVLLSLSMFGFYELQMPAALQTRLTMLSNRQQGGTLTGVAIMGFLSALIVGPCVTAPLVGALIYIAQTGDAVTGGLALFSLSIGMGVPLILIGVSAGKFLPRAGAWMDNTKAVFGVLLLAVAIWMLERVLPFYATMLLSAALLIVCGVYLGALEPVQRESSRWRYLWKGLGILLILYGAVLLVGASAGGSSLLTPLKGVFTSGTSVQEQGLQFRQVKGVDGLNQALETARQNGQPVMLDFYADWCVSCKEMEHYTFPDPDVIQALSGVLLLQTDVTANDEQDKALLKHFGLFGPPAILFFDSKAEEVRNQRVMGFMNAADFAAQVRAAL
ncbi:protein-disulfide reductase DsbD [Granulosicoccaceae sp. 1_MG-2023]|nr:protein-disulfide reductase DsbD [Granulosicoccaceae sp. 1_MG-2023]